MKVKQNIYEDDKDNKLIYKNYNIIYGNDNYNLSLNIMVNNINLIIKKINKTINFYYQAKLNSRLLSEKLKLNDIKYQKSDLLSQFFDEAYKDKKIYIKNIDSDKIYLIIQKSKLFEYEIDLSKEFINNDNLYFNSVILDLNNQIKEIKMNMNKKEDDIKNKINEKDNEISNLNKKIDEIALKLNEKEKNDEEKINRLNNLIKEQKEEICNLRKNINELNEFKKEMNILSKDYISNLDSSIIDNNKYNSTLKNWINPNMKIRANLLYKLSRDGPEISTFHKLCDNKGPTLTLFHLKIGDKIGFYVDDSFDSTSGWKKNIFNFMFNLTQNQIYLKTFFDNHSFYCFSKCGPSVNGLGCNPDINLNFIYHSANNIDNYFINGTNLLPSGNIEKEYEVIETEIFQIIKS